MMAAGAIPIPRLETPEPAFARAVAEGLAGKRRKYLSASWLYDDLGSALFEAITLLPEYGLTRADSALLADGAGQMMRAAGAPHFIIELGSGTGTKTRHLLEAAGTAGPVRYFPIDISRGALGKCAAALGGIAGVEFEPVEASYLDGMDRALVHRRPRERVMALFLGSTIGNFSRGQAQTFLRSIWQRLQLGDSLLLGTDLVKPRQVLIDAYDDPAGVTAAFNLNLLARINRELDGSFDLRRFTHEARYSERWRRVEMHLRSLCGQEVEIGALNLRVPFRAGETIWTESSHKFRAEDVIRLGRRAGFTGARQWIDREWGFAETLFAVA